MQSFALFYLKLPCYCHRQVSDQFLLQQTAFSITKPPAYPGKVGTIFFLSSLELSIGIAPASCTIGVFTPASVVATKFLLLKIRLHQTADNHSPGLEYRFLSGSQGRESGFSLQCESIIILMCLPYSYQCWNIHTNVSLKLTSLTTRLTGSRETATVTYT